MVSLKGELQWPVAGMLATQLTHTPLLLRLGQKIITFLSELVALCARKSDRQLATFVSSRHPLI